jgi:hypothetical protein
MEQKKKTGLLLASSIVGFAYWIGIFGTFWYFVIQDIKSTGQVQPQIGFFEGLSNLVKDFEAVKGLLLFIGIIALFIAPSVFSLISWKKGNKLWGGIASVLYILTFNLVSAIMCIIGTKPRFLEDRKTLLFIAGYIGIVFAALWVLLCTPMSGPGSKTMFIVFTLIAFFAVILNFIGWHKNTALITLIAGIVYVLSVTGIPSAVLCFIGRAQLKKKGV